MNTTTTQSVATPTRAAVSSIVLYEDHATGIRAKDFSDALAAHLDAESITDVWRCDLLERSGIATSAGYQATISDFVILSLRGDASLPPATRCWLESWLQHAGGGTALLIALFDPGTSLGWQVESTCAYLRRVAIGAGINFNFQAELAFEAVPACGDNQPDFALAPPLPQPSAEILAA
jgi:hypothetical protein